MNKGVILLSGGLDSYVSLACAKREMEVCLALTFDYGQKPLKEEIEASSKMAKMFNVEHKIIKLDFLSELLAENIDWVPNRNGLFLNIAGSFADKYGYSHIIIGANKEESAEFIDNSEEFLSAIDNLFEYSTQAKPKIYAPLKSMTKVEIINLGLELGLDFSLIKSCYNSKNETGKKHCGMCKSCKYLKSALEISQDTNLIKLFF